MPECAISGAKRRNYYHPGGIAATMKILLFEEDLASFPGKVNVSKKLASSLERSRALYNAKVDLDFPRFIIQRDNYQNII